MDKIVCTLMHSIEDCDCNTCNGASLMASQISTLVHAD